MKQKNLDNTIKNNENLMTRKELIEYLEKRIHDYNENEENVLYSGSLASLSDFERIAFDSPY